LAVPGDRKPKRPPKGSLNIYRFTPTISFKFEPFFGILVEAVVLVAMVLPYLVFNNSYLSFSEESHSYCVLTENICAERRVSAPRF
jgi:hypothetical protein